MKPHKVLLSLLLLIPLMACHKDIAFIGEESAPMLVINCLPCADSLFTAEVTASNFFLSNADTFKVIENATIALYLNGRFTENMTPAGNGIYQSSIRPSEGDTLRIEASAEGYEPVIAEDIFCTRTNLISIDTINTRSKQTPITGYGMEDSIGVSYSIKYNFHVKFSDPAGENYYRLVVKRRIYWDYGNNNDNYYDEYLNGFDDIVFGNQGASGTDGIFEEDISNTYNIFSDDLLEGKEYTISFQRERSFLKYNGSPEYTQPEEITIDLQAISKSYYLYLKTIDAFYNADGDLFSEKVQIYSNIQKGAGILGTRTFNSRRFWLP
jgi:hypothetical protein